MTGMQAAEPVFSDFTEQTQAPEPKIERFTFTGTGSEYFRIWIVNLLLTIVTLGIYSAWAKVRRTRYFYDNTHLAGSTFEYHGNPIAILKGRIVAVALFGSYNVLAHFYPAAALGLFAALMLVWPWFAWKSIQFKLFNSSYRGIRFGFRGSLGEAYKVFLFLPIAAVFTLYILAPFVHHQYKAFQHNESRFGGTFFSFHAKVGKFFRAYGIMLALLIGGLVALGIAAVTVKLTGMTKLIPGPAMFVIGMIAFYVWLFMLFPIFLTMIQKLVWNNTRLGTHRFHSAIRWEKMAYIMITNLVGIIFTLGLFIPFAKVRSMRYQVETMSMVSTENLDNFLADTQAKLSATSEGMADLLDFDFSL